MDIFKDFELLRCQDPFWVVVSIIREHLGQFDKSVVWDVPEAGQIWVHIHGDFTSARFAITEQTLRECRTAEDILQHPTVAYHIKQVVEYDEAPF